MISDDRTDRHWRDSKLSTAAEILRFDEAINSEGYAKLPALTPSFHNKAGTYSASAWVNVIQATGYGTSDRIATVFPSNIWDPKISSTAFIRRIYDLARRVGKDP